MLGFVPSKAFIDNCNFDPGHVRSVLDKLEDYLPIWKQLDFIIELTVSNFDWIYQWRLEQEVDRIQGLTESQVLVFVSHFMPVYKNSKVCSPDLIIELDQKRNPIHKLEDL